MKRPSSRDSDPNIEPPPSRREDSRAGRPRGVLLGAAVVVVVGLAAVIYLAPLESTPISGFVAAQDRHLFPDIRQRIDDIKAIDVRSADARYTLRNDRDVWRIVERDDYPVDAGAVEGLIRKLSELKALYVSENQQPDYAEYGVVAPSTEENSAKSATEVTVRDGDSQVLARAVVGPSFSVPGHERKKVFVRRDGDGRIWLADSDLRVSAVPLDWVERRIVDVPHENVTEITTIAPRGQRLVIARQQNGTLRIAEGRSQAPTSGENLDLENMAAALEGVEAEDVSSAERVKNGWKPAGEALLRTADGLTYRLRMFDHNEATWAQISADTGEEASAAEISQRAEQFNSQHSDWIYRLSPFTAEKLTTRPRDLIDRF